jgi:hypothetical protein
MGRTRWHRFDLDGERYYWTSYPSEHRVGDGPWQPDEYLTVSRSPNTPGVGMVLPAGTVVTEQHAIDLVRLAKAHGRKIP